MVECEFPLTSTGYVRRDVLIDTWWNVNIFCILKEGNSGNGFNRYMVECECYKKADMQAVIKVLIDTWWNVNTEKKLSSLEIIGFNRYMVECESDIIPFLHQTVIVLIDTWWNVNECLFQKESEV